MIWLFLVTYALAGATIGRIAWESDVFSDPDGSVLQQVQNRRRDIWLSVMVGLVWPLVPAWGLWIALRDSKE